MSLSLLHSKRSFSQEQPQKTVGIPRLHSYPLTLIHTSMEYWSPPSLSPCKRAMLQLCFFHLSFWPCQHYSFMPEHLLWFTVTNRPSSRTSHFLKKAFSQWMPSITMITLHSLSSPIYSCAIIICCDMLLCRKKCQPLLHVFPFRCGFMLRSHGAISS